MNVLAERLKRHPDELFFVLAGAKGKVRASVSPAKLEVVLDAPKFGVSAERVDPLWHSPRALPRLSVTIANEADAPCLIVLRNVTRDMRFRADYAKWRFAARVNDDLHGASGANAQDAIRPDGSLSLLLRANETRIAELEFAIPLEPNVEAARLLHEIEVDVEGHPESIELRSLLMLTHPPAKLLDMLPALYAEGMEEMRESLTPPETPFFERYLVGCADAIQPLKEALRKLDALFGAFSTPPDMLLWLAGWVCMPLDENWSEMKRRKLVQEAVELFRWRGTPRGLSRYLEIYTGVKPIIHDQPQPGVSLGPETLMGAPGTVIGAIHPHTFTVTIAHPTPEVIDERIVRQIVDYVKPAHTSYRLVVVRREAGRLDRPLTLAAP